MIYILLILKMILQLRVGQFFISLTCYLVFLSLIYIEGYQFRKSKSCKSQNEFHSTIKSSDFDTHELDVLIPSDNSNDGKLLLVSTINEGLFPHKSEVSRRGRRQASKNDESYIHLFEQASKSTKNFTKIRNYPYHIGLPMFKSTLRSNMPNDSRHFAKKNQDYGNAHVTYDTQNKGNLRAKKFSTQSREKRKFHSNMKRNIHQKHMKNLTSSNDRANIILIMTDDLDVELGSLNYMPRLLQLMKEEGALFPNAYTTTPMCCPSRSSFLTGMYIHNHQVFTNHQNCSSVLWQNTHEKRSFASYLKRAGYRTGYFGKYLNRYNGSHIPDGWQEWGGLVMNSRYYNYTVRRNGRLVKYGHKYPQDYYPNVITRDGVQFLNQSVGTSSPFLLVLSYPSPHGPEDSAPEHSHKFFNASSHHTASYNYAPNPDKQWLLQHTDKMTDIQLKFTDLLMTKRLQTLQSVDQSIDQVVSTVKNLGMESNTYIFFTSDHGYHLGHFGLPKGKSMPFEFDIKIPFFVRGPKVQSGVTIPNIALNVDLAPTFLDVASITPPFHMDGRSLLPFITQSSNHERGKEAPWRDSFLIESSGRVREEHLFEEKGNKFWEKGKAFSETLSDIYTNRFHSPEQVVTTGFGLYTSKHEKLEEICRQSSFSQPCKFSQKWYCVKIALRWKIKKCRSKTSSYWHKYCICDFDQGFGTYSSLEAVERRRQNSFLKKHLTENIEDLGSKFIRTFSSVDLPLQIRRSSNKNYIRHRRKKDHSKYHDPSNGVLTGLPSLSDPSLHAFVKEEELHDLELQIEKITNDIQALKEVASSRKMWGMDHRNSSRPNNEVPRCLATDTDQTGCMIDNHDTLATWNSSTTGLVEDNIQRLHQQLRSMKNILKYLQTQKHDQYIHPYENDVKPTFAKRRRKFHVDKTVIGHPNTKMRDSNLPRVHGRKHRRSRSKKSNRISMIGGRNKLYYPVSLPANDDQNPGKESSRKRLCLCEKRIARKIAVLEARDLKRKERMKSRKKIHEKKLHRRKKKQKLLSCNFSKFNCYMHDNDHWKTPPLWTDGKFCFCMNSPNNTYWCLRTINKNQNFLYCEFITGLITYYDMHIDPYQLRNVAFQLSKSEVLELNGKLTHLRSCQGAEECDGKKVEDSNDDNNDVAKMKNHNPSKWASPNYDNFNNSLEFSKGKRLNPSRWAKRRIRNGFRRRRKKESRRPSVFFAGRSSSVDRERNSRKAFKTRKVRHRRKLKKRKRLQGNAR